MPDLGKHKEKSTAYDGFGPACGAKHPSDRGSAGAWAGPAILYTFSPSLTVVLPMAVLPYVRLTHNPAAAVPKGDRHVSG
jgi:hypothetical protein